MHIRRVPTDPKHQNMFYTAYFAQFIVVLATVYVSARMYLTTDTESGLAALLMRNEIEMLGVLVGFSIVVVFMSWLDEAIELRLYSDAAEAEQCKYYYHLSFIIFQLAELIVYLHDISQCLQIECSHLDSGHALSMKNLFSSRLWHWKGIEPLFWLKDHLYLDPACSYPLDQCTTHLQI